MHVAEATFLLLSLPIVNSLSLPILTQGVDIDEAEALW
jgi:hypothetical protein